jgi:hypothetical protein
MGDNRDNSDDGRFWACCRGESPWQGLPDLAELLGLVLQGRFRAVADRYRDQLIFWQTRIWGERNEDNEDAAWHDPDLLPGRAVRCRFRPLHRHEAVPDVFGVLRSQGRAQGVAKEPGVANMEPGKVQEMFFRRLYINYSETVKPANVKFERVSGGWNMKVNYEVRRPLIGNLDVVGNFDAHQD